MADKQAAHRWFFFLNPGICQSGIVQSQICQTTLILSKKVHGVNCQTTSVVRWDAPFFVPGLVFLLICIIIGAMIEIER